MAPDVILDETCKDRLRRTQPDGAGGEIDIVGILGAGWIGLRTAIASEVLKILQRLVAE
jgi:hypothetical protein